MENSMKNSTDQLRNQSGNMTLSLDDLYGSDIEATHITAAPDDDNPGSHEDHLAEVNSMKVEEQQEYGTRGNCLLPTTPNEAENCEFLISTENNQSDDSNQPGRLSDCNRNNAVKNEETELEEEHIGYDRKQNGVDACSISDATQYIAEAINDETAHYLTGVIGDIGKVAGNLDDDDMRDGMVEDDVNLSGENTDGDNIADSDVDVDFVKNGKKSDGKKAKNSLMYECFLCGKTFKDFHTLEQHERKLKCVRTKDNRFRCSLCNNTYANKSCLMVHIRNHGEEKPFSCTFCEYKTKTPSSLKYHIRCKHTHEKPFACKTCGKRFYDNQRAIKHERSHDAEVYTCKRCNIKLSSPYDIKKHKRMHPDGTDDGMSTKKAKNVCKCSMCEKSFAHKYDLQNHIAWKHENIRPFKCDTCGEAFTSKHILMVHTRNHTGEKPYKCAVCGKTFKQNSHLRTHQNIHKTDEDKPYKCPKCPKAFNSSGPLKDHLMSHAGKTQPCDICGKLFYHLTDVRRHMKLHLRSEEDRTHCCEICSKSFFTGAELTAHVRTHTGFKPHICSVCSKRFISASKLKEHQLTHTGEKRHQCQVCDKKFSTAGALRTHAATHSDAKPHSCSICAKNFATRSLVCTHEKIHNENREKPYACSTCGKCYGAAHHLKRHIDTIHNKLKPFACEICGKSFTEAGNLKRHKNTTHSNKRPHACATCGKRFKLIIQVNAHMLTHREDLSYKCSLCQSSFKLERYLKIHTKKWHQ